MPTSSPPFIAPFIAPLRNSANSFHTLPSAPKDRTQVHEVVAGRVWQVCAEPTLAGGGRGALRISADPSAMPALVSVFPWQMPGAAAAIQIYRSRAAAMTQQMPGSSAEGGGQGKPITKGDNGVHGSVGEESKEEAWAWLAAESAGLVYAGLLGRCKTARHALRRLQETMQGAREEVEAASERTKAEVRGARGQLAPAGASAVQTLLSLRWAVLV